MNFITSWLEYMENKFPEYPLKRVPQDKRKALITLIFVWMGFTIHPANPLVGGVLAQSMHLSGALLAGMIGGLMLVGNATLSGYIGYKEGYSVHSVLRNAYGVKGAILPVIILWAGITGWAGFSIGFTAQFISQLTGWPAPLLAIMVGLLFGITALMGIRAIFWLGIIASPLLMIFSFYASGRAIIDAGGWSQMMGITPALATGTMGWAIGTSFSSWVNGTSLSADFSRYAKKFWHVPVAALIGFIVGNTLLQFTGTLTTYGKGTWDIVEVFSMMGLLSIGFLFYFLANWTSTDNQLYSGGLAMANMTGITKIAGTIFSMIIAIIAASSGIYQALVTHLTFLGVLTPPTVAVLYADYFIVKKYIKHRPYQDLENIKQIIRPTAIVAWAIGAFGDYYMRGHLGDGPLVGFGMITLNGMVITFIVYIVLELIFKNTEK